MGKAGAGKRSEKRPDVYKRQYPVQAQRAAQPVLKQALEQADGLLGLINTQQGRIPLGNRCV